MVVSVDFIMDNVTNPNMNHERYPLKVYGEPVIDANVQRMVDFITVWPCKQDRISIMVQFFIFQRGGQ